MIDDDAELLRLYATQSCQHSFADLVRRHIDLVYSAAISRLNGDGEMAKDITQQVFIDLAHKAHTLSLRSSLAGWLFIRARLHAKDAIRANIRRRARESEALRMNESTLGEVSAAAWERVFPFLGSFIERLSKIDREIILLRFFEQRSFADIGCLVGISGDAAQKRVGRSLDKLRLHLSRAGISSTSAALIEILAGPSLVSAAPASLASTVTANAIAAGGGMGAGTISSLISLMNTTKVSTWLAVAATLLLLSTAMWDRHVVRESGAELNTANRSYVLDQQMLHSREREVRDQGLKLAAMTRSLDQINNSGPESTSPHRRQKRRNESSTREDPAVRANRAAIIRWMAEAAGMSLSSAEVAAANEMLSRSGSEAQKAAFEAGGERSKSLWNAIHGDLDLTRDVNQLAAGAVANGAPLSPEQATQIAQVFQNANTIKHNVDWDKARAAAASVLNPDQLIVFDSLREQSEFQDTLETSVPNHGRSLP